MEQILWEKFKKTGKIEDYLYYNHSKRVKNVYDEKKKKIVQ